MTLRSACLYFFITTTFTVTEASSGGGKETLDVKVTSCITNCTCTPPVAGPQLTIDCLNRLDGNSSSVAEEIDNLLIDKKAQLTDLTIVNSPLQYVPSSICRLIGLRRLVLNANQLVGLPLRCFNNMTNMVEFHASYNNLTEIQVGITYEYEFICSNKFDFGNQLNFCVSTRQHLAMPRLLLPLLLNWQARRNSTDIMQLVTAVVLVYFYF